MNGIFYIKNQNIQLGSIFLQKKEWINYKIFNSIQWRKFKARHDRGHDRFISLFIQGRFMIWRYFLVTVVNQAVKIVNSK